jgi:FkbM family methyltransferase
MKRMAQSLLLVLYRMVAATGLMSTRFGRRLFETTYFFYKRHIEAEAVEALHSFVREGSVAIDVGANLGFFTRYFAQWCGPEGKVIAIEPEEVNFRTLKAAVARDEFADVVEALQGVAAAAPGEGWLRVNPYHPGDHRLADDGVPVTVWTIDNLLAERGWPDVSLIKIDVQGAEVLVLNGATETLARFRPALFIEVDDGALRAQGSSARDLMTSLAAAGYSAHELTEQGPGPAMDASQALASVGKKGTYHDFLFLSQEQPRH